MEARSQEDPVRDEEAGLDKAENTTEKALQSAVRVFRTSDTGHGPVRRPTNSR